MSHTETVNLVIDATRADGVLYHTLTETAREDLRQLGRAYLRARFTPRADEIRARILQVVRAR